MTQNWEPGTQYNYNDVVCYEGKKYKIIQPHRSQGDWAPTVTPALWGRIPDDHCAPQPQHCPPQPQHCPPQQQQQHHQPPPYQQPIQQQPSDNKHEHQQPPNKGDDSDSDGEGKKWYKDPKKLLGIAGGVAGGAALIGAGVAVYKHHERKKDQKEWLEDAQSRAATVRSGGSSGPVNWILNEGKNIPQNAIPGGKENSGILYIARGFHKGSVTPGKASSGLKTGAVIGYAHDEIDLEKYEVLVGDSRAVRWVAASGKLNLQALGARPVEGGYDTDGTPLFVARAHVKGAVHPGKASESLKAAFIPYGGGEEEAKTYEILCYN